MKLEEKTSIVTGAGQGIGKAIALTFAEEGSSVVVNDVSFDKADVVAKEIEEADGEVLPVKADVAKSEEVHRMVEKTIEHFNKIDVLVNNAGVQTDSSFVDLPEEDWDKVLNVNLKGPYLCSQMVVRHMIEQGGGKIVNISSIHSSLPRTNRSHYNASKSGLEMLSKDMALELAEYNINVNCVAPGAIATPMNEDILSSPERLSKLNSKIPFGRMGKPEEVAKVVLFLASDDADYITGASIILDGGLSCFVG